MHTGNCYWNKVLGIARAQPRSSSKCWPVCQYLPVAQLCQSGGGKGLLCMQGDEEAARVNREMATAQQAFEASDPGREWADRRGKLPVSQVRVLSLPPLVSAEQCHTAAEQCPEIVHLQKRSDCWVYWVLCQYLPLAKLCRCYGAHDRAPTLPRTRSLPHGRGVWLCSRPAIAPRCAIATRPGGVVALAAVDCAVLCHHPVTVSHLKGTRSR